jgi:predicted membrane-bound spermidine synthase
VIFADFWLLPRLGLRRDFAAVAGLPINIAAAAAWLVSVAFCVGLLVWLGTDKIYFVSLPGWFVTVAVYIALSRKIQKQTMA